MRQRKGSRANPRSTTLPGFSLTRLHSDAGKWMFHVVIRGTNPEPSSTVGIKYTSFKLEFVNKKKTIILRNHCLE